MKKISILATLAVVFVLFFLNPFLAILIGALAAFFFKKGGST
ncbi:MULTISPECIES: hypothetical protein [Enterococcus]|uniref:Uncharacterized protein n=1 Tax=Enterococcus sulfureus ATCC 49903 TaxID=1140003 RepID=S0KVP0_9ENTE|nr:hypothetical protein [Enterococcus sulfureus]EOT48727.1 hypothetical protein OMY_00683 [Enterococcus sulfureus ATCC 49903]EOT87619.1 hypothetical protein I573_00676 [Enterococcus sulfureus ATCC 49903]